MAQTVLNTSTEGTALASLAAGSRAISNDTGDYDNSSLKNRFLDMELLVDAGTVTAGAEVAEVYILPKMDGSNYPDGSTSLTPPAPNLAAKFFAPATTGQQRMVVPRIPIGPFDLRFLLVNTGANAFSSATTHTLKVEAYKYS